jgi:hypothetical protein
LADAASLSLVAADGQTIPLQAQPLDHWSDRSVKWLLLDFILPLIRQGCTRFELAPDLAGTSLNAAPIISVKETNRAIVITTGGATFQLSRTCLPMDRVLVGSQDVLEPGAAHIVLTDAKGGQRRPRVERVTVEARGPIRATVKYEGRFTGRVPCRFVARFCFFAHTGLVRTRLAIHNPNRACHKGGLWDLGDRGSLFFRDLAFQMELKGPNEPRVLWKAEETKPFRSVQGGILEIFQASSGGDNWQSKNHVNGMGQVPCPFRGYRLRGPDGEEHGHRASPVVSVQAAGKSMTVVVPEFWQQLPKALEVEGRQIRTRLFPRQWGDLFELQGGEQKTHTVWMHFGADEAAAASPLGWAHQPARAHAAVEWYAGSGAIPYLIPSSIEPSARLESYLGHAITGVNSLFARREVIDEYGWRHFGEVYADHEGAYYRGPAPVISHYNNQYDVVYGTILQYLRTGDTRWHDLFDPLARHVIDIDIYRTTKDRPAYNGGLFWHTDHYKDAARCTHRTYSSANCSPADPSRYGGGPANEHNYTSGLLHYFFLTGDPQARDTVVGLADWVIAMDSSSESVLGLIDDSPSGMASKTCEASYHGPGRGCGNSVNALLDGWLLTRKRGYLDKAEELIRRSIHPADDIADRNLLNLEYRWSYTVFLSVLARYLDLKAEAGELDRMYAYARASLLSYACWMLENEEPYFDHPEKLEFPTETWAAQEFRKANVFRLAAAHADPPLRERLLRCGTSFAERAWSDLLRFDSRHVARAIALILVEGVKDSYFCQMPVPEKPPAPESHHFGSPPRFVPQKARVLAQLKSVPGLLRALARLGRPRFWRQLLSRVYRRLSK